MGLTHREFWKLWERFGPKEPPAKADPEPNAAKFAPGRRGGIVSEDSEDDG